MFHIETTYDVKNNKKKEKSMMESIQHRNKCIKTKKEWMGNLTEYKRQRRGGKRIRRKTGRG